MRWCGRQSIKRLVDLITAVSALAILVPLLGLIALAVWLIMGSPILFRQQRRTWQLGQHQGFLALMRRSWDGLRTVGGVSLAEARRRLLAENCQE
jgi:hypothetical protein